MDGDPGALVTPRRSGPEVVGSNPTGPTKPHAETAAFGIRVSHSQSASTWTAGSGPMLTVKPDLKIFGVFEKLSSARAKSSVGPASSRIASAQAQRLRFRLKDLSRRLYRRGRLPEDNLWAACPSEGRAGSKNFEPTRFSGKRPSATSRRSDDVIFLICLKPSSS